MKKRFWIISLLVFAVCLPWTAGATIYDLKTDWSDTNNPNGVWTYRQGVTALPSQADYAGVTGQYAWANAQFPLTGHVPVWIKASVDNVLNADVKAGDIMVHPTSVSSSLDLGNANVVWTSPINGTITISGNVWWGGWSRDNRGVAWDLSYNSSDLASGALYTGSSNGRSNPVTFGSFTETVSVGDTVMFEAVTASGVTYPWFVGVNLSIDAQPARAVPVPPTALLLAPGLAGLAAIRRRVGK